MCFFTLSRYLKFFLLASVISFLFGCSVSIDGNKYQAVSPAFDPMVFFNGDIKAWGIVQNRSGNVVQRFQVDIKGSVKDNILTLDETFVYGMGEGVEKRIWNIKKLGNNRFEGGASDILGQATGSTYGNAMKWEYLMDLPVGDKSYKVKFEDWIWAFDKNTIVNRSYIKKFGFVVAEVTIFMQKNKQK